MNIALLSDSPTIPTGYRNQALQLANYLHAKGHNITWMANAYNGMTLKHATLEDGTELPFKIYGELGQTYFANSMSRILKKEKIDRFIILLDTFMLYQTNFLMQDLSPAKSFFWFPSDGGRFPNDCEKVLMKVDVPVAMAKFGQKQIKDYFEINTKHIPHGINTKQFYKLDENTRNKLKLDWALDGKFVIGVVARNQPRKNLDRTLKTMALLKETIPNAVLFLHLDPHDPANGMFNMMSMIKKLDIENHVVFSGMDPMKGFPDSKMNEIYNLFDCFLLTTSGEGFGIPIIEAMSCEVPVLMTDYTTCQELVKDNNAGLGIQLSGVQNIELFNVNSKAYDSIVMDGTMTGTWDVERGFCSITDAVNKIIYLAQNPTLREEMGKNGRKAVLEQYDFNKVIGPMWEELIK
jgi:glycosyltransferase involved in cell wall biosynthesis